MTYKEQLDRPEWQKKRLEILDRDNWTCQHCDSTTEQLHVHHRYYVSGRMAWEYPGIALQTLCKHCHAKQKEERPEILRGWELLMMALWQSDDRLHDIACDLSCRKSDFNLTPDEGYDFLRWALDSKQFLDLYIQQKSTGCAQEEEAK
jgi:hypothetical protein